MQAIAGFIEFVDFIAGRGIATRSDANAARTQQINKAKSEEASLCERLFSGGS